MELAVRPTTGFIERYVDRLKEKDYIIDSDVMCSMAEDEAVASCRTMG